MKLILASSSPRRSELLQKAGIEFEIIPSSANEYMDPALSPPENARVIALRKAETVAKRFPARLTLAADTFVVLQNEILQKPKDESAARDMLHRLSEKEHSVYTGVAIVNFGEELFWSDVIESKVKFKKVSSQAIDEYVRGGEPMDKAGAYAIQGGAKEWIESYSGSLSNIIGLPMETVREELSRLGYIVGAKESSPSCR